MKGSCYKTCHKAAAPLGVRRRNILRADDRRAAAGAPLTRRAPPPRFGLATPPRHRGPAQAIAARRPVPAGPLAPPFPLLLWPCPLAWPWALPWVHRAGRPAFIKGLP